MLPIPTGWAVATEVAHPLATAMVCVLVIDAAVSGIGGNIGRVLEAAPVRYIGKISYGLYVIHFPMMHAFVPMLDGRSQLGLGDSLSLQLAVALGATVATAVASWHFFEAPLNRLKSRFHD